MIEKYDRNYLTLKSALAVAGVLAEIDNIPHNIYKNSEGIFRVTNFELQEPNFEYYITVYPFEPSEMSNKENGLMK